MLFRSMISRGCLRKASSNCCLSMQRNKNDKPCKILAKAIGSALVVITTIEMTDGGSYEGERFLVWRHGRGKMTYSDGSSYEGNWLINMRIGTGFSHFPSGKVVCGRGYMGRLSEACISFPDGSDYRGEIDNLTPNGNGQLVSDMFHYEGDFKAGKFCGKGILTKYSSPEVAEDGYRELCSVYKGSFQNDQYNGKGTLTVYHEADQAHYLVYTGKFIGGKREGLFVVRNERGVMVRTVLYKDDEPVV